MKIYTQVLFELLPRLLRPFRARNDKVVGCEELLGKDWNRPEEDKAWESLQNKK